MSAERFVTKEIAHVEVYGRHVKKIVARMVNVSSTGAFLEMSQTDYLPREGDMVCVTVHLTTLKKSRVVHAQVVWNRGLGFGIQFMGRDELVTKMISNKMSA